MPISLTPSVSATGNTIVTTDSAAQFFKYPANLGLQPFDKWIFFEAKSGRHVQRNTVVVETGSKDRTLSAVGLYLSETALRSTLSVAYETTELGPLVGAAVAELAQGGKNITDAIFSVASNGIESLKQAILSPVQSAEKAFNGLKNSSFKGAIQADLFSLGAGILGNIGAGNGGQILGTVFGIKPNPRTDLLFDTVGFREYEMSFMLIPRTLAEARTIDRIITFFQFYMLPKYEQPSSEGGILGSYMLGFPYEFEISVRDGNNNRMEHVSKYERCILKSIHVDHAAAGKTAFIKDTDGDFYPVASNITLSFQEVRLLDRQSDAIRRSSPDNRLTPFNLPDPRT